MNSKDQAIRDYLGKHPGKDPILSIKVTEDGRDKYFVSCSGKLFESEIFQDNCELFEGSYLMNPIPLPKQMKTLLALLPFIGKQKNELASCKKLIELLLEKGVKAGPCSTSGADIYLESGKSGLVYLAEAKTGKHPLLNYLGQACRYATKPNIYVLLFSLETGEHYLICRDVEGMEMGIGVSPSLVKCVITMEICRHCLNRDCKYVEKRFKHFLYESDVSESCPAYKAIEAARSTKIISMEYFIDWKENRIKGVVRDKI